MYIFTFTFKTQFYQRIKRGIQYTDPQTVFLGNVFYMYVYCIYMYYTYNLDFCFFKLCIFFSQNEEYKEKHEE